jgi:hypothetical protein
VNEVHGEGVIGDADAGFDAENTSWELLRPWFAGFTHGGNDWCADDWISAAFVRRLELMKER